MFQHLTLRTGLMRTENGTNGLVVQLSANFLNTGQVSEPAC